MSKLSSKCSSCGYTLTFDPEEQTLLCSRCGNRLLINMPLISDKHDYSNSAVVNKNEKVSAKFECSNCGAKTNNNDVVTGICPYCGSSDIKELAESIKVLPDGVVPFKITKKQAKSKYREWLRKKRFVPNKLKQHAKINKMEGMYFPCWDFAFNTASKFSGVGVRQHTRTRTIHTSNGTRTTSETYYTRHPFSGSRTDNFADLLVNANSKISMEEITKLGNYGVSNDLKVFNTAYLLGFESSGCESNLHTGCSTAKRHAQNEISENAKNSTGYFTVENFKISTQYLSEKYNYVYLPVWICNFIYKQETYKFLVNGYTGYVQGKVPRSVAKILSLVFGILAVIAGIVLACVFLQ